MANFTFNANVGISTSDGIQLALASTGNGANAKQLLDDVFAGSVSIDFAPLIASITNPLWFILLCSGDGAKLKFDGVATFTAKAYKSLIAGITPNSPGPSGVLDLEVETNGASAQRVRFLAVGDPD